MRLVGFLAVGLLVSVPLVGGAADAPHEDGLNCSKCHMGHNAVGGALTNVAGNANLCESCHALHSGRYGFPWATEDQATSESGRSHRWDAPAANRGATPPTAGTPMGDHLDGGSLKCSTCHDQHQADLLLAGDPANLGTVRAPITFSSTALPAGTGTMTFAANSPVPGAASKLYLVQIVAPGDGSTATFRLSNDKGTSWFGCSSPGNYTQYVASPSNACVVGPSVRLNDDTNVTVAFEGAAGAFKAGDQWDFYVSYPFLRVSNKDGAMCTTCHQDRKMYWQDVEGGNANGVPGGLKTVSLGTTVFHHPVGQALRSPVAGGILDANGAAQSSGDGIATNDLALGTGGIVTCMTCHHPHNADSNSLSEDPR